MLTFYLNGKQIIEDKLAADQTLLRYLRTQQDLVGTKEGCASGDCGACTVLVGEYGDVTPGSAVDSLAKGQWRYKSVNACILFMTQLAGKSVITVEALAHGNTLHPAQQALVELHGSQCGFCTPGFVMSMAGLFENHKHSASPKKPSRHEVEAALSGNLCRCTGYRPIIDAAQAMFDEETFPEQKLQTNDPINIWQPEAIEAPETDEQHCLSHANSQTWTPRSESALKALLSHHPDAQLVAGATDLALVVTQMHRAIHKLICLNGIEALKQIHVTEDAITIGAAVTYSGVESLLKEYYPEFGTMLDRLGSRQIRNSATLGGNIANASPIGDTPPVLIALNAEITLSSIDGERRLPIEQFFIDYKVTVQKPGEYIKAIHIPRLKDHEHLKVYKISKRLEDDISAVLFAAKLTIENQQIKAIKTGFGGMAAIPKGATHLERALQGKPLCEQSFIAAANRIEQDFTPIDDVRATAAYRLQVAKGLIQKCGIELLLPHNKTVTRIEHIQSATIGHTEGVPNA